MKTTPQLATQANDRRKFPPIAYHYHEALETSGATAKERRIARRRRGFWRLSTGFFSGEARLDYATEFLLFSVITMLSAWPTVSMLVAIMRMVRNY